MRAAHSLEGKRLAEGYLLVIVLMRESEATFACDRLQNAVDIGVRQNLNPSRKQTDLQPGAQMLRLRQAVGTKDIEAARALFKEYGASLGFSLCFQSFDEELAGLPGDYAPPAGRLLLAGWTETDQDKLAGCVALHKLEDGLCEMKRLYVRPEFRGKGIGQSLAVAIVEEGREI